MNAVEIVNDYIRSPYKYWKNGNRHALRIERRLSNAMKVLNMPQEQAIGYLSQSAEQRISQARPSIYICSAGSSGSHWLQSMITDLVPVLDCGEVYLPPEVVNALKSDVREHTSFALQLIYLIYSFVTDNQTPVDLINASACNTAHAPAMIGKYKAFDISCIAILLIRDPLDLVLSRTFRKDEYRNYISKTEVSDLEYLNHNCDYVNKFFATVNSNDFQYVERYENLVNKPADALNSIIKLLGDDVDDISIDLMVKDYELGKVVDNSQLSRRSNVFAGKREPIPEEMIHHAEANTLATRLKLGYVL